MGRQVRMSSRNTLTMACLRSVPCCTSASTRCLKLLRASATAEFSTMSADEQLASEPRARNSKRFPVKAKGEVRLRSVLSISNCGIWSMSSSTPFLPATAKRSSSLELSICANNSLSCVPRNEEMMAGGASCPPRRCAFVALIIDAFSSPLWRYTPISVSTMKTTKRRFSS